MRKFWLLLTISLLCSVSSFAGKNLSDYPVQIQVIESHWHRHRHNGIESVDGWGRGNFIDGSSIRGFDFTYESSRPFERTVGDAHYLAKWKKESLTVRDDVYVRKSGGAVAVSQQEYKDKWAKGGSENSD
jgi:hypothetical protein